MAIKNKQSENATLHSILLLAALVSVAGWGCSLENYGGHGEDCAGVNWGDFEKRPLLDSFGGVQGAICVGMDENMGDVNKHVICCPVTRTCLTEAECYDWSGDGDSDSGDDDLSENQPDGDDENEPDGDEENESDGDDESDSEKETDEDAVNINFEDGFSGETCSPDGLCWISSWPQGNDIHSIRLSSDGSVWLGGESGLLMNFENFDEFKNTHTSNYSPDIMSLSGLELEVYAVGGNGLVRKFDGINWNDVSSPPNSADVTLNGVYVDSMGVVYVVAENGMIFNRAAGVWSVLKDINYALNDIHGADNVYIAVGADGAALLSTNGSTFNQFPILAGGLDLNAVWGLNGDSFIAVGEDGAIMYYDGNGWNEFAYVPPVETDGDEDGGDAISTKAGEDALPDLYDIVGVDDRIYIVGDDGFILRLVEGVNSANVPTDAPYFIQTHMWEKIDAPFASKLRAAGLSSRGELIVAGMDGDIYVTAESIDKWYQVNEKPLFGIIPGADEETPDVYFRREIKAFTGSLMTAVFAALSDGSIMKYSMADKAWEEVEKVDVDPDNAWYEGINDMWMSGSGDLYLAAGVLYSWDQESPMLIAADPGLESFRINSIYGRSDNEIYLAGEQAVEEEEEEGRATVSIGKIFLFNGVSLHEEDTSLDENPVWNDIHGDGDGRIFAVGADGRIAMKDTTKSGVWNEFALQLTHGQLNAVWGDGGALYVAGNNGFLARLDSESRGWKRINLGTSLDLVKIFGYNKNQVIVGASNGALWATFNGADFSPYDSGMSRSPLTGIWGDDMGNTFFANLEGDVVQGELEEHDIPDGDVDGDIVDGDDVTDGDDADGDEIVDGDDSEDAEEEIAEEEDEAEIEADGDGIIDGDDEEEIEVDEEEPPALQCGDQIGSGACSLDSCLCYANPLPFYMDVRGMWISPSGALFVVGADGSVVKKNSSSWEILNLGGAEILDIAGTDDTHLFLLASDALYSHDGESSAALELEPDSGAFIAMSADSSGKLYVLEKYQSSRGDAFKVHHYNGSAWSISGSGQNFNSTDIWAYDDTHVYVSGTSVYKWNGSEWAAMVPDSASIYQRIFGTGADEFYMLTNISFYRYNGSGAMEKLTYDTLASQLYDLWGTDSDDIYIVGRRLFDGASSLYHYDGSGWTHPADTILTGTTFSRVYGSGDNLYVSSTSGDFYTFNLTDGLDPLSSAVSRAALNDVWVFDSDNIYAAGEDRTILHYNGSVWTALTPDPLLGLEADAIFEQLWGDPAGHLFLYAGGSEIIVFDPSSSSWDSIPITVTLDHFVAISLSMVYTGNTPYFCNGTSCLPLVWTGVDQRDTVNEYWTDGAALYAATPWGIYRMNSGQMDKVYPAGATVVPFTLISGSSDSEVAAAGISTGNLVIVRKNGSDWSNITGELPATLTPVDLEYVNGDIFFIGRDTASVLRGYFFDGSEWTELLHFPGSGINSLHGAAAAPFMICGDNGLLMDFSVSAE